MRILKIIGWENKGNYAIVHVLLEDGGEGEVYIGGTVDVNFDPKYNKVKVFVKRKP